eukprot:scaffold3408_cov129-Amphora_coffeaeformis.AAC.13
MKTTQDKGKTGELHDEGCRRGYVDHVLLAWTSRNAKRVQSRFYFYVTKMVSRNIYAATNNSCDLANQDVESKS